MAGYVNVGDGNVQVGNYLSHQLPSGQLSSQHACLGLLIRHRVSSTNDKGEAGKGANWKQNMADGAERLGQALNFGQYYPWANRVICLYNHVCFQP
jgi:hypothetical protein